MAVKGLKDTIYRGYAEQPPALLKMNYGNKVRNEYMKEVRKKTVFILPEAALYNNILLRVHYSTYIVPSKAYIIIFFNIHG